jgi:dimethylamine/trimethylamine dehydrogenase
VAADAVRTSCVFTGRERDLPVGAAVFVTARLPQDAIYRELLDRRDRWGAASLQSVKAVGDCLAPGTIAAAVWEGRRYAEELERTDDRGDRVPFRREVTGLTDPAVGTTTGSRT